MTPPPPRPTRSGPSSSKPFAVVGAPTTDAWAQEIANAGIVCVACGSTESAEKVAENAPYWWPTGMNPEQADAHLVEMVGKQLVGKPAEFAGDEAMQSEERVFGWIQAETETDEYKAPQRRLRGAARQRVRR